MRTTAIVLAITTALSGTAAFADHYAIANVSGDQLEQMMTISHNFLTEYGYGDFDVTTLTVSQMTQLMAIDLAGHPDQATGKEQIGTILGIK
jgi:hypothetical protein